MRVALLSSRLTVSPLHYAFTRTHMLQFVTHLLGRKAEFLYINRHLRVHPRPSPRQANNIYKNVYQKLRICDSHKYGRKLDVQRTNLRLRTLVVCCTWRKQGTTTARRTVMFTAGTWFQDADGMLRSSALVHGTPYYPIQKHKIWGHVQFACTPEVVHHNNCATETKIRNGRDNHDCNIQPPSHHSSLAPFRDSSQCSDHSYSNSPWVGVQVF